VTDWTREWKKLAVLVAVLAGLYWLPVGWHRFNEALLESLRLARWYAREHVILCLLPALFIAGAIGVFVARESVMKYLGPGANKVVAYGVASVSGTILAVCSCTVLPLFAGIHRMGAGLGPAVAFLYSGPAVNVLAIILTARILGPELGIARAVGAVVFSVVIGLAMQAIHHRGQGDRQGPAPHVPQPEGERPLWKNAVLMALMVGILVFANWGRPDEYRFETHDGRSFEAAILSAPAQPEASADANRPAEGDPPRGMLHLKLLDGPEAGGEMDLPASAIARKVPLPSVWTTIWRAKWAITCVLAGALGVVLVAWLAVAWWKVALAALPVAALAIWLPEDGQWVLAPFIAGVAGLAIVLATSPGEGRQWVDETWGFARLILPLLLGGVLVAGFLLGRPGAEGLIPSRHVAMLVGDRPDAFLGVTGLSQSPGEWVVRAGWPVWTNLLASLFGALMYFATLTEVPILQGLLSAGMGKGPALSLLLAGPALSLPNMLVIAGVLGAKKTVTFVTLVVVMATVTGLVYGAVF
jgi:hypothetical protein